MTSPISPVAIRQDGGFFSDASSATLYPMAGMRDNASMPMVAFEGAFAPGTNAPDRTPLLSYGSIAPAAEIPAQVQMTASLTGAQSCFDMVKSEQAIASYDLDRLPKTNPAVILLQSNQKAPASKRGPFATKEARDETAATRKRGSCIRCRMQRIRVSLVMGIRTRTRARPDAPRVLIITDLSSSALPTLTRDLMGPVRRAVSRGPTQRPGGSPASVPRSRMSSSSSLAMFKARNGRCGGRTTFSTTASPPGPKAPTGKSWCRRASLSTVSLSESSASSHSPATS
jgi:hypothetical protein